MRPQTVTDQHANHFVPRRDPVLKAEVVNFGEQALRKPQADRLLCHRFCCHITDITCIVDVTYDSAIITDITDTVNADRSPRGRFS